MEQEIRLESIFIRVPKEKTNKYESVSLRELLDTGRQYEILKWYTGYLFSRYWGVEVAVNKFDPFRTDPTQIDASFVRDMILFLQTLGVPPFQLREDASTILHN